MPVSSEAAAAPASAPNGARIQDPTDSGEVGEHAQHVEEALGAAEVVHERADADRRPEKGAEPPDAAQGRAAGHVGQRGQRPGYPGDAAR